MTRGQLLTGARALFVSPHLDDVALSCAGLVRSHVTRGEDTHLVTVFSAAPPPGDAISAFATEFSADCGFPREEDVSRFWEVRRTEDLEAARVLGVPCHWLSHRDAIYRGYDSLGEVFGPLKDSDRPFVAALEEELVALWRETDHATVYLPLAIGRHVDHQLCASFEPQLAALGAETWFYEDYPYAEVSHELLERTAELPLELRVVDTSAFVDARIQAIAAYRSQKFVCFGHQSIRERVLAFAGARGPSPDTYGERLWRIRR